MVYIVYIFLENTLNLGSFTHSPLPIQSFSPSSYHHPLLQAGGKLLIPASQRFFENLFPATAEREETMIYFLKIKSENMKMTRNITLFILVFQM